MAGQPAVAEAIIACQVKQIHQGIHEWREELMSDPTILELIKQSDDERMQEAEDKFAPVQAAVHGLVGSLEKASVPASLIVELEDVLSTIMALSIRAAASDPAALAEALSGGEHASNSQSNAGLSIQSTALGRRASASYRVFDRMGGWEILSACVEGVYLRLMKDPRIGEVNLDTEQTLKTTLLEFLSAAFSGIHGRAASCSMWKKHQEIVNQCGLDPTYFDCLIEHFQATLDELGVPKEEAEAAVTALSTSKPHPEEYAGDGDRTTAPARLSLFGRQSLRTSLSLTGGDRGSLDLACPSSHLGEGTQRSPAAGPS